MKPKVYIIAANGARKTTFATEFLPRYAQAPQFINADLIAQGLSPFSPETAELRAGRIMLDEIWRSAVRGQDFGFETTLAGKIHLRLVHELREIGYDIRLLYRWVPSAELALSRIKTRELHREVSDAPAEIVRRRFERSLSNFFQYYRTIVNSWMLLDNSTIPPAVIASQRNSVLHIIDRDRYHRLLTQYGETL